MLSLDENAEILAGFGLTRNQAKVYISVAKLGIASINQISKASKVRREDIYRILPKLERMGLVEKLLGKPTKVRAAPAEDALSILIEREQRMAKKRVNALETKREAFLKHFNSFRMKSESEEAHFALVPQRIGIINKEMNMIRKAQSTIDIITSRDKFRQFFINHEEALEKAIEKRTKVRMILNVTDHENSIVTIMQEYESLKAPLYLKYTDHPSSHYLIVDSAEALIATSTEATMGRNPYLWTDDDSLIGLLQKNFESIWHSSVDLKAIETEALSERMIHYLKDLKPTNHAIFLYDSPEAKHNVLFNYLKIGLENGEAGVYVTSEENPSQIREAMEKFGIHVEKYEKTGALTICGYEDIYLAGGEFDVATTMNSWSKLYNGALKKGFKGLRVTGETAWFFRRKLVPELVEYEKSLHTVLNIPMIAICAYDTKLLIKASNPMDLYNEFLKAHGTILFSGIDKQLGRMEIRAS